MRKATIRYGFPVYALLMAFAVPTAWALLVGVSNFLSYGYFHRSKNYSFYILLALLFLLLFIAFRVAPAYRVVLSDEGISRTYRITFLGFKIYEDKYGNAGWNDAVSLDTHSIGWVWGLALFFSAKGKHRTVWLNRCFTSKEEALRIIASKLPERKITERAKKKLKKMGILVD